MITNYITWGRGVFERMVANIKPSFKNLSNLLFSNSSVVNKSTIGSPSSMNPKVRVPLEADQRKNFASRGFLDFFSILQPLPWQ